MEQKPAVLRIIFAAFSAFKSIDGAFLLHSGIEHFSKVFEDIRQVFLDVAYFDNLVCSAVNADMFFQYATSKLEDTYVLTLGAPREFFAFCVVGEESCKPFVASFLVC